MVENMSEMARQLMETIDALLARWGTRQDSVVEIRTNVGTIHRQRLTYGDTYRIGPHYHNWPHEWMTVQGWSITGDPFRATAIIVAISEFLASEDWRNKVDGSIGMLKRIHDAIS